MSRHKSGYGLLFAFLASVSSVEAQETEIDPLGWLVPNEGAALEGLGPDVLAQSFDQSGCSDYTVFLFHWELAQENIAAIETFRMQTSGLPACPGLVMPVSAETGGLDLVIASEPMPVRHVEGLDPDSYDPGMVDGPPGWNAVTCRDLVEPMPACFYGSVALYTNSSAHRPVCSAVVISPNHVLTAAHCLFAENGHVERFYWARDPTVGTEIVGRHLGRLEVVGRFPDALGSPADLIWEDTSPGAFQANADIAILRLSGDGAFHPIRVPAIFTGSFSDLPLVAVGYGVNPNEQWSGYRQWVSLARVTDYCPADIRINEHTCDAEVEFVSAAQLIQDTSFVGWDLQPQLVATERAFELASDHPAPSWVAPDTCAGDSGGPVFASDGGTFALVGLTSRGLVPPEERNAASCNGYGGIYTQTGSPSVVRWIRTVLEEEGCIEMQLEDRFRFAECA